MSEKEFNRGEGSCIIAESVIATIVETAALEVPGVASMAVCPTEIRNLVTGTASKSVKVENNQNEMTIDVYLNLKNGARIPDVATAVQRGIKVAVQSMTGRAVTRINVHVMGVEFEGENN